MNWFLVALSKYAVFSGRACRREYWYFFLFFFAGYLALYIIDAAAELSIPNQGVGLLSGLFSLVLLLPLWAVTVRRLHDTGRSGWWTLLGAVPILGGLILLFFVAEDGDPKENRYGKSPKKIIASAEFTSQQQTTASFCTECGKPLAIDMIYCPTCGKKREYIDSRSRLASDAGKWVKKAEVGWQSWPVVAFIVAFLFFVYILRS
jgi:uncharacterized membrane protein YhaH (DUF805 family)/predicted RNA-binding Zn-ribbon protein involved in translation (DUF1610 family)